MKYVWFNGTWIPRDALKKDVRARGPNVIGDVEEFQAIGLPGAPHIGSRSTLREQLRRHNKIEIGSMSTEDALKQFTVRR